MIVSHKNKFVFVHIPKTGGTSIVQALYPYLDPEQDIIIGGHERHDNPSTFSASEYEKNNQLHKHSSAVEIKKVIGQDIWDEYFIFAFVRNPFARVVSLYEWWKQTEWVGEKKKKKEIKEMTFKDFTKSEYTGFTMLDSLTYKKSKKIYSQYSKVMDVDFVGKLEDVHASFAYICGILNLPRIQVGVYNKSSQKNDPYEGYYDEESLSNVGYKFSEDAKAFGYHFNSALMEKCIEDRLKEEEEAELIEQGYDQAVNLDDLDVE
tara:strand:- start:500 stop:1288 length:789 start_codon:yes stop_codon:yes gene_type:complete